MDDVDAGEAARRGVELAFHVMRAKARDDDAGVLHAINTASPPELGTAVAYLAGAVQHLALALADGDAVRAREIIDGSTGPDNDDAIMAAVERIVHDARDENR